MEKHRLSKKKQKKKQSKQQKLNKFCAEQCPGVSCSSAHGKPEVSNRRPEGYSSISKCFFHSLKQVSQDVLTLKIYLSVE